MKTKILLSLTVGLILVYFLSQVFSGKLILPQIFSFGPITLRYYGIIMALAVLAGWALATRRLKKYQIEEKTGEEIIFWLIIFGFIGARLYHVLSSVNYYQHHFFEIFKVWNGGLSVFGAILGGIVALSIYKSFPNSPLPPPCLALPRRQTGGRQVWKIGGIANWLTPSLILGQIVGRFGNLFNYEAFGYPTSLPWKMFVPENFRPQNYLADAYFHPWFLYEQLGLVLILIIIFRMNKSATGQKDGLFVWYILLYNILRFSLEFLRSDSVLIGNLRLNSIVSLVLILLSLSLLIAKKFHLIKAGSTNV